MSPHLQRILTGLLLSTSLAQAAPMASPLPADVPRLEAHLTFPGQTEAPPTRLAQTSPTKSASPEKAAPTGDAAPLKASIDKIQAAYASPESLQCRFIQTSSFATMGTARTDTGTFQLKRGGKMRWDFKTPEARSFISDGSTLWIYAPEEKTVMTASLSQEASQTALNFMFGLGDIGKDFVVSPVSDPALLKPGFIALTLTPKETIGTLKQLVILASEGDGIVREAVVAHLAALQQGTHKTKGKSEVAGSTRKLYRQKGTGNARMGSVKSPSRRHGGIAFGPVPRSHAVSINKKARKRALASVIATKIRNNELLVVDDLKLDSHKTRGLVSIMKALNIENVLFVYAQQDDNFQLATRNLPNVKSTHSTGLNCYDALNYRNLVITKEALQDIEGRLLK